MRQTESIAAPSNRVREGAGQWITLKEFSIESGVSMSQCKAVLDVAKVRRRVLPGQVWTRYYRPDVEEMLARSVTRGPAAD